MGLEGGNETRNEIRGYMGRTGPVAGNWSQQEHFGSGVLVASRPISDSRWVLQHLLRETARPWAVLSRDRTAGRRWPWTLIEQANIWSSLKELSTSRLHLCSISPLLAHAHERIHLLHPSVPSLETEDHRKGKGAKVPWGRSAVLTLARVWHLSQQAKSFPLVPSGFLGLEGWKHLGGVGLLFSEISENGQFSWSSLWSV